MAASPTFLLAFCVRSATDVARPEIEFAYLRLPRLAPEGQCVG